MNPSYPTNMTDEQWELLLPLLPSAKPGGRPRSVDLRAVVNDVKDLVDHGYAWRMLPQDFPKWKMVDHCFRAWRLDGTWEQIHTQFVDGLVPLYS